GININPLAPSFCDQFTIKSDSAGGMFVIAGLHLERVDTSGNIVWNKDLSQSFSLDKFDVTADGMGGAYALLRAPFPNDTAYFVHFNSAGENVTHGIKKTIGQSLGNFSIGKITLFNSSSTMITI